MDLVVTILTIFLLIALGTIVFLINDAKKKSDSSVLSEQLEEKISNSIESVYAKREEDFKKSSKENIENIIEPFKKRIKEFEEEVRKNTSQQHEFHTKTKLSLGMKLVLLTSVLSNFFFKFFYSFLKGLNNVFNIFF